MLIIYKFQLKYDHDQDLLHCLRGYNSSNFSLANCRKKYYFYAPSAYNVRNPQLRVVSPRKKILFGNNFYSYHAWGIGLGNEPFQRLKCEVKNCEFTDNLADFNTSDAVLFHIHQLAKKPPHRFFLKQRWIFWMLESPGWSKKHELQGMEWGVQFDNDI